MIDAAATAVCDAGPIIHLDELGCLDLLYDFPSVVIPSCVANEVNRNRHVNLDSSRCIVRSDDHTDDSMRTIARLYSLHQGELSVLAAAQRLNKPLVLTDVS